MCGWRQHPDNTLRPHRSSLVHLPLVSAALFLTRKAESLWNQATLRDQGKPRQQQQKLEQGGCALIDAEITPKVCVSPRTS